MNGGLYIAGYPRSGTTWLTRLVAIALKREAKFSFRGNPQDDESLESRFTGPPVYKTHDPAGYVPSDRSVHIVRDVRDVICSMRAYFGNTEPIEETARRVKKGYFNDWLPWDRYINDFAADFCSVRYEDLHADPSGTLEKVLEHLGQPIDNIDQAVQACTEGRHLRLGRPGQYKDWDKALQIKITEGFRTTLTQLGYL